MVMTLPTRASPMNGSVYDIVGGSGLSQLGGERVKPVMVVMHLRR
jgi:hypothetical protein